MTQITETHAEKIVAACRENLAAIAESLNLCIDRKYQIEVGRTFPWNADQAPSDLDAPGLTVAFKIGDEGVLCLIPADLPLPEWYTAPGDSEESRLQTLALEWSINMLPPDLEAGEFRSAATDNLKQQIADSKPFQWATCIEFLIRDDSSDAVEAANMSQESSAADKQDASTTDADADAGAEPTAAGDRSVSDQPAATMYLIAAVTRPPFPAAEASSAGGAGDSPAATSWANDEGPVPTNAVKQLLSVDEQLLTLPVTVSVRLADKKISLGQLLSMTPGGLITFNKSCEDLLDLYVNNQPFCQGEAIKIGEKFGLKITHVGVESERQQRVL
jgi:flagellar motor switch protein FliN/FliY